jgi:tetratricopeptide (TPR) repeat protein
MWFSMLFVPVALAQEDLSAALVEKGKPSWEPKGKALETFGRGDTKRGTQAWDEAITILIGSLKDQPGCGKCLQSLGRSLNGAERYDDAVLVGEHLAKLFPDHKEGPSIAAIAQTRARRPEQAVAAWDKYLLIDPASVYGWHERHLAYLRLGEPDSAEKVVDGGPASLGEGDRACFKTEVALSRGSVDDARLAFGKCLEGGDTDVKRMVEGWLLLQEGKIGEAQSKLAQGGAEDDTRLSLAMVRLSEGKYEQSINLTTKLVTDASWALDGQLAHARGLYGQGKVDEALKVLDQVFTRPGWEAEHPKYTRNDVILFLASPTRAKDVCVEALALKMLVLTGKGDAAGAEALRVAALKVHGEHPLLAATLPAPAPAAPAPK